MGISQLVGGDTPGRGSVVQMRLHITQRPFVTSQ